MVNTRLEGKRRRAAEVKRRNRGASWAFAWLTEEQLKARRDKYRQLYPDKSAAWIDGLIASSAPLDAELIRHVGANHDRFPGLSRDQLNATRRDVAYLHPDETPEQIDERIEFALRPAFKGGFLSI